MFTVIELCGAFGMREEYLAEENLEKKKSEKRSGVRLASGCVFASGWLMDDLTLNPTAECHEEY